MAIDTIKTTAITDDAVTVPKIDFSTGNVVIGTATATNPLTVRGDTGSGTSAAIRIRDESDQGATLGVQNDAGMVIVNETNSADINFQTGGSTSFQIKSSGDAQINDGNLVLASSHGIDFSGNANASGMSSELLDDYEEGTWTAQIVGSTTNPSSDVLMPSATYTKIGRLVFVQFQFSNVNTTGASGGVRVSGLPFAALTSHGTGNILTYVGMTFPTTSTNISPYVSGNAISFYYSTSNQGWAEITHNATSGVYLAVTATYQTNA